MAKAEAIEFFKNNKKDELYYGSYFGVIIINKLEDIYEADEDTIFLVNNVE